MINTYFISDNICGPTFGIFDHVMGKGLNRVSVDMKWNRTYNFSLAIHSKHMLSSSIRLELFTHAITARIRPY